MRWLLKQAGNPQTHFPTVHIVGTNGKGSTTSYLQNILTKSGYQVGTFTSPYITRFNERISINGTEIPDKDLISLVAKAQVLLDDLEEHTAFERPTEFELVTLLMFLYFDLKQVDMAIIELELVDALIRPMFFRQSLSSVLRLALITLRPWAIAFWTLPIIRQASCEKTHLSYLVVSLQKLNILQPKSHDLQAPLAIIDREIQLLPRTIKRSKFLMTIGKVQILSYQC